MLGVVNSEGLHNPGPVRWPLALCLLAAWVLIFLCMLKGIRSSGKVTLHKVVIVCSHKTHPHTHNPILTSAAVILPSKVCFCVCVCVLGGLCHRYLPILCAHCLDHQRSNVRGLSSGCCLLPHSRLGPVI